MDASQDIERLPSSLQESVLTLLAFGKEQGQIAAGMLTAKYFDAPYDDIARRALDYRQRYGCGPGAEHIDDLFDHVLLAPDNKRAPVFQRILMALYRQSQNLNEKYVLDRVGEFVRRQTYKSVIYRAGMRIQQGGDGVTDDVESILNEAFKFRVDNLDPGTFLHTPKALSFLDADAFETLKLGIGPFDRRDILPTRGELFTFIAPRGRGKCIAAGELLQLPSGERKKIEDVVRDKDKKIMCLDTTTGRPKEGLVVAHYKNGIKPCITIETRTGRTITVTHNHLMLTETGWKAAGVLVPGKDRIAASLFTPNLGKERIARHKLRLLAYLIADGSLTKSTWPGYTKNDPYLQKDFERCVKKMGDMVTWSSNSTGHIAGGNGNRKIESNHTLVWLRELGLVGKPSRDKFVPHFVFCLSDELIAEFLRALFSGDGSIHTGPGIHYVSASKRLVLEISTLLNRLGILNRVRNVHPLYKGRRLDGYAALTIRGKDNVNLFLKRIGFLGKKAKKARSLQKELRGRSMFSLGCRPLSQFAFYDLIKHITDAGPRETYDVAIDKHHNLCCNDLIAHNSWFATHCSVMGLLQRWRVLDISLEMDERRKTQRIFQSMFTLAKRDDSYAQTKIVLDSLDRLESLDSELRRPSRALGAAGTYQYVKEHQDLWHDYLERLSVKSFPSGSLTMRRLRAHLDFLEQAFGFVPDLLVVDYPLIMYLDENDKRGSLGRIFVELRGLAQERGMAVLALHQSTRAGENAVNLRSQHTAEDISIIGTTDIAITYNATETEQKHGLARLHAAKVRNDQSNLSVLITQDYNTGQFVLESAPQNGKYWQMLDALKGEHDLQVSPEDDA